eukprot:5105328-Pleurochrysis_carterae.AAC.1
MTRTSPLIFIVRLLRAHVVCHERPPGLQAHTVTVSQKVVRVRQVKSAHEFHCQNSRNQYALCHCWARSAVDSSRSFSPRLKVH